MDATPRETERRRAERLAYTGTIQSSTHSSESISLEKITGVLRDISGNGLSFLCDTEYLVGDMLDLEINLPGSRHHLLVQVVRVELLGDSRIIGVYFIDMSSDHERALIESLFSHR